MDLGGKRRDPASPAPLQGPPLLGYFRTGSLSPPRGMGPTVGQPRYRGLLPSSKPASASLSVLPPFTTDTRAPPLHVRGKRGTGGVAAGSCSCSLCRAHPSFRGFWGFISVDSPEPRTAAIFPLIPRTAKCSWNTLAVTSTSSPGDSQEGPAIAAGRAPSGSCTPAAPCAFSPGPSAQGARPARRAGHPLPPRKGVQRREGDLSQSLASLLGAPAGSVLRTLVWEDGGEGAANAFTPISFLARYPLPSHCP